MSQLGTDSSWTFWECRKRVASSRGESGRTRRSEESGRKVAVWPVISLWSPNQITLRRLVFHTRVACSRCMLSQEQNSNRTEVGSLTLTTLTRVQFKWKQKQSNIWNATEDMDQERELLYEYCMDKWNNGKRSPEWEAMILPVRWSYDQIRANKLSCNFQFFVFSPTLHYLYPCKDAHFISYCHLFFRPLHCSDACRGCNLNRLFAWATHRSIFPGYSTVMSYLPEGKDIYIIL
jgi:hypothetical protein